MTATTKACAGWSRYNNGSHSPCDHPANGDDGWCDIHRQASKGNPMGAKR